MNEGSTLTEKDELRTRENALIGYQAAINLWSYQGEQVWARFNIMVVVNSILIAVIGIALAEQQSLIILEWLLPIMGLLLCIVWFIFMQREVEYCNYYILSARELEEKYLSDSVNIVSRGGAFSDGDSITINIGGKPKQVRMSKSARILRTRWTTNGVILIFTLLYVATLVQRILR